MTSAVLLSVGPAEHGVIRLIRQVAGHLPVVAVGDPAEAGPDILPVGTTVTGIHFTDQLFGPTCDLAANEFCALVRRLSGIAVVVTLHDVPMPSDDPARYARRSAAYARVVDAARTVLVSSRHEADLLRQFCPDVAPAVLPLPLEAPMTGPRPAPYDEVAILGFVYPGKGHLAALDALPRGYGLLALGRAAAGHAAFVTEVECRATRAGRQFNLSGWVADDALAERLRRVAVPLVAHEQLSASASIGTWLAVGRRPLVPDGPYTRELEERSPGSVTRYQPGELATGLDRAIADPDSTWLDDEVRLTPSAADVACRYQEILAC